MPEPKPPAAETPLKKAVSFGVNFAVIGAAASALAYGLQYSAYGIFFSRFGTNPEEAGLDRNAFLSQAIWLPLAGLAFEAICYAILAAFAVNILLLAIALVRAKVWHTFSAANLCRASADTYRRAWRVLRDWRVIVAIALLIAFGSTVTVVSGHAPQCRRRGECR